jgi:hypothetical protein
MPPENDPNELVDLIPDELALARAQVASGLPALAEATLRRHAARLEIEGERSADLLDTVRLLLAEALWRQQRPLEAGRAISAIRSDSPERSLPLTLIIAAEANAAAGYLDRAKALLEHVVRTLGPDEAWRLRAGTPTRLSWPLPPSMRPTAAHARRPAPVADEGRSAAQTASAHARLEGARLAFGAGDLSRGDRELSLALRLDGSLAEAGLALMEPTLGDEPPTGRLLLYGDLLRAVGRSGDAGQAYDRAARTSY